MADDSDPTFWTTCQATDCEQPAMLLLPNVEAGEPIVSCAECAPHLADLTEWRPISKLVLPHADYRRWEVRGDGIYFGDRRHFNLTMHSPAADALAAMIQRDVVA